MKNLEPFEIVFCAVMLGFFLFLATCFYLLLERDKQEESRYHILTCGSTVLVSDGQRWSLGQNNGVWRGSSGTYVQKPGETCTVTYREKAEK